MTTPYLGAIVAILYFACLWHNRGAFEERRLLESIEICSKRKRQMAVRNKTEKRASSAKASPEPSRGFAGGLGKLREVLRTIL